MAQQCSILGLILLLFDHLRMALIYGQNYLCRVFVELSLSSVNVMGLILKAAYPIISTKAPPPVISTKRSARRNLDNMLIFIRFLDFARNDSWIRSK